MKKAQKEEYYKLLLAHDTQITKNTPRKGGYTATVNLKRSRTNEKKLVDTSNNNHHLSKNANTNVNTNSNTNINEILQR